MSVQRAIRQVTHDTTLAGTWMLLARPPGVAKPVNLTVFRGLPIQLDSFSFSDPFGPASLEFTVPGVSAFEQLGQGDLLWAKRHADVDLIWRGAVPPNYSHGFRPSNDTMAGSFAWEGYITTFGVSSSTGLKVQAKGAMLQLDNYLAKPEYSARPIPYEWAIARQFLNKPALRVGSVRLLWPSWWNTYYNPVANAPSWMIPTAVIKGQKWSGLVTRETGSMDPALTSYIQTLISAMYTERGRFTLMLDAHRQPVIYHQDDVVTPDSRTVMVNGVAPGVVFDFSEDWDQTLTDVYAQGTSLAGVTYSGMEVSADGAATYYQPAAALRQTYPTTVENGWFDRETMPKEVMLQVQQGLEADDAAIVARAHLSRFSDPGMTGTVTLSSDPMIGGWPVSRFLVRAGMPIFVSGIGGRGLMGHITESTANMNEGTVSLTVDTKFRDALTVNEVKTRGRDALSVTRMLVAGQYSPAIPDTMWPWSYSGGSGYIPSNSLFNAVPLFRGMPRFTPFPWTAWTRAHPPKDKKWTSCYIRVGPAQASADKNWSSQQSPWGAAKGIPVKMSQAGSVKLLQVGAYDRDGNVLKIPFHVSIWYYGSVNVLTMPGLPAEQARSFPPYAAGQRYPFFKDAFEGTLRDGTRAGKNDPRSWETCGPVRIYGTYDQKVGYFPGQASSGDAATGLLVDETQWSWNMDGQADALWDPYTVESNYTNKRAGSLYFMFYADAQQDQEVFFLGRIFRVEPGAAGG